MLTLLISCNPLKPIFGDSYIVSGPHNTQGGSVDSPNQPLSLTTINDQSVTDGEAIVAIDVNESTTGTDLDHKGDPLNYFCKYDQVIDGKVASPINCSDISGLQWNEDTAQITWTPNNQEGTYEFKIIAYSASQESDEVIFSIVVTTSCTTDSSSGFHGGDGSAIDPYQICNPEQLNHIGGKAELMDSHFIITAPIDLQGIQFNMIGSWGNSFKGNFNGNNQVISNLSLSLPGESNIGFFRAIGGDAQVHNVKLQEVNIVGSHEVGALAGSSLGQISNSSSIGSVEGAGNTGGLVGYMEDGEILNSFASGLVSGSDQTGGLVGHVEAGEIKSSFASANVSCQCDYIGGLIGFIEQGHVLNSYATGSVSGVEFVGGLIGFSWWGDTTNSYATGAVEGGEFSSSIGGLIGENNADAQNSFWDESTSGQALSSGTGLASATAKNSAEMKNVNTFTDTSTIGLSTSWDFNNIWKIDPLINNGYPSFIWQTQ